MAQEKGIHQRLQIGAPAIVLGPALDLSIVAASNTIVCATSDFFAAAEVGMRIEIDGFASTPEKNPVMMEAYVKSIVDPETLELDFVYDGFGEVHSLVDEAAGSSVTVRLIKFHRISEEQSLTFDGTQETEETGSKERGGQSAQSVISHGLTFQCSGKADFPDTNGLARIKQAFNDDESLICRVIENSYGHIWEGPFSINFGEASTYTENIDYTISGSSAGLVKYMETGT